MKPFFLALFFLAAAAVLVGDWLDILLLYQLGKPLIMIGLAGYYTVSLPAGDRSPLALFAFFFAWLGDVALMFPGDTFFMLGLIAFLISHLFYIGSFRQHRHSDGNGLTGIQKVRYSFPVILAGTGLMTILYPSLNGLEVPVSIYAVVLTVMVLQALFRSGYTGTDSFWRVLSGAILFMLSDSLLSVDKFLSPLPAGGLLVMFTYMSAQFLIVKGLLRHR